MYVFRCLHLTQLDVVILQQWMWIPRWQNAELLHMMMNLNISQSMNRTCYCVSRPIRDIDINTSTYRTHTVYKLHFEPSDLSNKMSTKWPWPWIQGHLTSILAKVSWCKVSVSCFSCYFVSRPRITYLKFPSVKWLGNFAIFIWFQIYWYPLG